MIFLIDFILKDPANRDGPLIKFKCARAAGKTALNLVPFLSDAQAQAGIQKILEYLKNKPTDEVYTLGVYLLKEILLVAVLYRSDLFLYQLDNATQALMNLLEHDPSLTEDTRSNFEQMNRELKKELTGGYFGIMTYIQSKKKKERLVEGGTNLIVCPNGPGRLCSIL